MGPWGPKMGVPPKKAPILRKMPFRVTFCIVTVMVVSPNDTKTRPHDDVVVVV